MADGAGAGLGAATSTAADVGTTAATTAATAAPAAASAAGTGTSMLGDLFNNALAYVVDNPLQSGFAGAALGSQIYGMANPPKPPRFNPADYGLGQAKGPGVGGVGAEGTQEQAQPLPGTRSSPVFNPTPKLQGGQGLPNLADPKRRQGGMAIGV